MRLRLSHVTTGEPPATHAPARRCAAARRGSTNARRWIDETWRHRGGRPVWSNGHRHGRRRRVRRILGPNGVGKSTLLKAILGLVPLSAGDGATCSGGAARRDTTANRLPAAAAQFDSSLRVRGVDVVRLGLDGDRWGLPLPDAAVPRSGTARVDELVDLVGATAYAHRPIGELSGGEQQRCSSPRRWPAPPPAAARRAAGQPGPAQPGRRRRADRRICRSQNVAVMIVAHDVNPILSYLDRVVYLGHGGAVPGPPSQVITPARCRPCTAPRSRC